MYYRDLYVYDFLIKTDQLKEIILQYLDKVGEIVDDSFKKQVNDCSNIGACTKSQYFLVIKRRADFYSCEIKYKTTGSYIKDYTGKVGSDNVVRVTANKEYYDTTATTYIYNKAGKVKGKEIICSSKDTGDYFDIFVDSYVKDKKYEYYDNLGSLTAYERESLRKIEDSADEKLENKFWQDARDLGREETGRDFQGVESVSITNAESYWIAKYPYYKVTINEYSIIIDAIQGVVISGNYPSSKASGKCESIAKELDKKLKRKLNISLLLCFIVGVIVTTTILLIDTGFLVLAIIYGQYVLIHLYIMWHFESEETNYYSKALKKILEEHKLPNSRIIDPIKSFQSEINSKHNHTSLNIAIVISWCIHIVVSVVAIIIAV